MEAFEEGLLHDGTDDDRALKHYLIAAEGGYARACVNAGVIYHNRRNFGEAVRWYNEAVRLGNKKAMFNLGLLHMKGWGVPKCEATAARCWYAAAEDGVVEAQNLVGNLCYNQGKMQEAKEWYVKAAAQGHEAAQTSLAEL